MPPVASGTDYCPTPPAGSAVDARADRTMLSIVGPTLAPVAHDPDRLTHAEAAKLLGVHPGSVARWVVEGKLRPVRPYAKAGLLRADVERLSLARWREGDPSWLTAAQVAERLGVTRARVYQLSDAGRLPFERTRTGAGRTGQGRSRSSAAPGGSGDTLCWVIGVTTLRDGRHLPDDNSVTSPAAGE